MRALRFHTYGSANVLVVDDVPRPPVVPGRALVKVMATTFNPADIAIRSGAFVAMLPLDLPHTLGMDLAGTVVHAPGSLFRAGDAVVAFLPPDMTGAAAEYVSVPTDLLVAAPTSIPLEDAAALPSTGTTAWQALFEHGQLEGGQRVLVNGAGSVVGGLAVQLAVGVGARVDGFAGPDSLERVRGYGAEHVFDHTIVAVGDSEGFPYDLVVNFAPTQTDLLWRFVGQRGRLVSATTPIDDVPAGVEAVRMAARPDPYQLARLVQEVDAGRLQLNVTARRPLAAAADVHESPGRGKTLLLP